MSNLDRSETRQLTGSLRTPNPEIDEPTGRKYHTNQYKIKILNEIEECTVPGGVGAILRREGLYSSTISGWRRQRASGKLGSSSASSSDKIIELEKEIRRLKRELEQANLVIDIQKKISNLIESKESY